MKKGMILVLSLFFLGFSNVSAASSCSYQEQADLNGIAAQVKASYEVKTGVLDKSSYGMPDILLETEEENTYQAEYKYFEVSVLNITEETYVVISDGNGFNRTARYSDTTNGIYRFDWKDLSTIATLTIEVYSSNKTGCPNEKYRVLYLTLPKSNYYATSPMCANNEEFYLCNEFVTFDEPSYDVFEKKVTDYQAGKITSTGEDVADTTSNAIVNFINEHKVAVIACSCLLVVGVVTVITLNKKRRNNR